MATNVTFKAQPSGPDGRGSEASATISLADVTVNSVPNAVGGWTTAVVTADKQQSIYIDATAAAANAIPQGWYINAGDHFRRHVRSGEWR